MLVPIISLQECQRNEKEMPVLRPEDLQKQKKMHVQQKLPKMTKL
jgi:hypothetical protein